MKKLFSYAIAIAIVIAIGSAVKPYWKQILVTQGARSRRRVRNKKHFAEHKGNACNKLKEEGYRIGEDEIYIEKDSKNTVTITVRYSDKISIFGKEIQKLQFTVSATEKEIKEYY